MKAVLPNSPHGPPLVTPARSGTLGVTIPLDERQPSRLTLSGGNVMRLTVAELREPIRLTFRRRRTRHESHRGLPRKAELAASRCFAQALGQGHPRWPGCARASVARRGGRHGEGDQGGGAWPWPSG